MDWSPVDTALEPTAVAPVPVAFAFAPMATRLVPSETAESIRLRRAAEDSPTKKLLLSSDGF